MEGYHGAVCAYGQTSTGKTHTMMGAGASAPGVVPLAIDECFAHISRADADREYVLRVSYLEIYNEALVDLLCPTTPSTAIRVLDDKLKGVVVHGLKEHVVMSPAQVTALIAAGEAHRHVGQTAANDQSSRSHTIFRMVIESRLKDAAAPGAAPRGASAADKAAAAAAAKAAMTTRVSILNLVDLAGSESARLAGYADADAGGGARGGGGGGGGGSDRDLQGGGVATRASSRQKEGGFINKSLLTLGHVVSKLVELQSVRDAAAAAASAAGGDARAVHNAAQAASERAARGVHVPYRDSKLTRLLQPSLSGAAQVAIVCTVTPAALQSEETLNTLKFAARAKRVRSRARRT